MTAPVIISLFLSLAVCGIYLAREIRDHARTKVANREWQTAMMFLAYTRPRLPDVFAALYIDGNHAELARSYPAFDHFRIAQLMQFISDADDEAAGAIRASAPLTPPRAKQ
ncbi:MAG: hypothetical protein JWM58_569 [Rhizobium sp.]|nr:hypothetical protein [Rhizobium sp.]